MTDYYLRILVFLLFVSTLLYWQWSQPRKPLQHWQQRWRHNLGLLLIDSLLVRFCQPLIIAAVALLPSASFAPIAALPATVALIVSLILLDLLIYWQHRLFHNVTWLWRLHRVHHSDPELDTTSAVRFHPIEIVLSLIIKGLAVWLLGIPALAVLIFDIVLNSSAMFNHTNIKLPNSIEPYLRRLIVTPEMHRIHHSRISQEANSNYGFCLSIWDRLFHSYTENSQLGDAQLNIGLPDTQRYAPKGLIELLNMPFSLPTQGSSDAKKAASYRKP